MGTSAGRKEKLDGKRVLWTVQHVGRLNRSKSNALGEGEKKVDGWRLGGCLGNR